MEVEIDKRLSNILRHIENVRDDCILLGNRLIEEKEVEMGRMLIANGLIHDNSKLYGIEWAFLHPDMKEENPEAFKLALRQHNTTNKHHSEYWNGIDNMPPVYIAEMVVDWKVRSGEFGTDFWDWVKEEATKRYKFSCSGKVYKEIKKFAELLFEPKFT
jgi:hypothetical protein